MLDKGTSDKFIIGPVKFSGSYVATGSQGSVYQIKVNAATAQGQRVKLYLDMVVEPGSPGIVVKELTGFGQILSLNVVGDWLTQ